MPKAAFANIDPATNRFMWGVDLIDSVFFGAVAFSVPPVMEVVQHRAASRGILNAPHSAGSPFSRTPTISTVAETEYCESGPVTYLEKPGKEKPAWTKPAY
jgi:hypothetical protein